MTDLQSWSAVKAALPPAGLDDVVAVSTAPTVVDGVRGSNLALRSNGTVVGWGAALAGETTPPADLTDVVGIDLGSGFALAVRSDGSVVAWGDPSTGVTDVPADLGSVKEVAALGTGACQYALALRLDGSVAEWGGVGCDNGMPYQVRDGSSGVTAIAAGVDTAIALKDDGTVRTWGPAAGATRDGLAPDQWTDIVSVSTQSATFAGLRSDRTAVAYGVWGENGAPNNVTDVAAVSAGVTAAYLKTDGSAYVWPQPFPAFPAGPYQAVVGGLNYVLTIDAAATTSPTPTPEPTDTVSPSPEPTDTVSPSPEPTDTVSPSPEPTDTVSPSPEPTDTVSPSPEPTDGGTVSPTPDPEPTGGPVTEPPAPTGPVLGSDVIQPSVDTNPSGTAEAFVYTANASATVDEFHLYLDAKSSADKVIVGVYSDRDGVPGRLLSTGRITRPEAGAWNTAKVTGVKVEAGQHYWLSLLAPVGSGQVYFRDQPAYEGHPTYTSAQRWLSSWSGLPDRWRTGRTFGESPASMYVS